MATDGDGIKTRVIRFANQDYVKLRKRCVRNKKLFSDRVFSAKNSSLGDFKPRLQKIVWKRPGEISAPETPMLIDRTVTTHTVYQGTHGNPSLASAMTSLVLHMYNDFLLSNVMPDFASQEWNKNSYAGIFRFNFWRYNKWVEVVVDDRLPMMHGKLVFSQGGSGEYWMCLVEKALAKLYGSYHALIELNGSEFLEDLTGGVSISMDMHSIGNNWSADNQSIRYEVLLKEYLRASIMIAWSYEYSHLKQHIKAYIVTEVKKYEERGQRGQGQLINYLRLKYIKYTTNKSMISLTDSREVGCTGDYFVEFNSFCKRFSHLVLCRLANITHFSNWKSRFISGDFSKIGGLQGQQWVFDADDEEILIQLTLKQKCLTKKTPYPFCLKVFECETNRYRRITDLSYQYIPPTPTTLRRSYTVHALVRNGRYAIVPQSFGDDVTDHFLIRFFIRDLNYFAKLEDPRKPFSLKFWRKRKLRMATQILVKRPTNPDLTNMPHGGIVNIIFMCGDEVVDTILHPPKWRRAVMFYRNLLVSSPIRIQFKQVASDDILDTVIVDSHPWHDQPVQRKATVSPADGKYGQFIVVISQFKDKYTV